MRYFSGFLAAFLLSSAVFSVKATSPAQTITGFYSFENDMEGWVASAADVEAPGGGGSSEPWSITRSQDIANDGATSLKLFLANFNDGGKVFIEKPFEVERDQIYRVRVEYALGARDYGSANLWQIVAGALTHRPEDGGALVPAIREKIGNGQDHDVGYVWLNKSYDSHRADAAK